MNIPRPRSVFRLGQLLAAASLLQGATTSASAQLLVRPKPAELRAIPRQLDPALLPPGATQLVVEIAQIFRLVQDEPPATIIVPVHFKTPQQTASGPGTSDNCGVYLLPVGGKPTFQLLISDSLVPHEQCLGGVAAVGAHIAPGQLKANAIFIYKARTAHGIKYRPTILRWSFDADAYISNPEGSQALLEEDHVPTTIREVLNVWARPS